MYDFAKEMYFVVKAPGNKSTRYRTLIKILKLPAILASGTSNTIFLSFDPDKICDRITLLLQERHAGNISDIINEEIFAIVHKLLEYNCMSKKQHKKVLFNCNQLHEQVCIHGFFIYKSLN